MPINSENPNTQFAAVEELLKTWLQERQDVLAKYTQIAILTDSALNGTELESQQKDLCALLVDYISAGHFEVFHQLIAEAEAFADGSEKLAANLMPAIADTTEVIMAYEEKYSAGPNGSENLERDLSALGESLESRFVLEDQLIAGLHYTHRQLTEGA